jgi:hypothetical protein
MTIRKIDKREWLPCLDALSRGLSRDRAAIRSASLAGWTMG